MTSNIIKDRGDSGDLPNKKNKAGGFLNKETYFLSPTISNVHLLDWEKEFDREFVTYHPTKNVEPWFKDKFGSVGPVKAFIRSQIQSSYTQGVNETIEKVEEEIKLWRPYFYSGRVSEKDRQQLHNQLSQLKIKSTK